MSDAKVRGIVHVIEETKTYGQKGFRKRLVVLEQENDRFANYIPLEFIQDGCDTVVLRRAAPVRAAPPTAA